VIQNQTLSRHNLVLKTWKSHTAADEMSTVDVPILLSNFWPKITVMKVLCGKVHCYDAEIHFFSKTFSFSSFLQI
jgi:hypothetical protein